MTYFTFGACAADNLYIPSEMEVLKSEEVLALEQRFKEFMNTKIPILPTIPKEDKLDGTNYGIWRVIMESILQTYDMLEAVTKDIDIPSSSNDPDVVRVRELVTRLNARIRSFIFLSCSSLVIAHIKHLTEARQIWLHLEQLYDRKTPMKRASLEIQMRSLDPAKSKTLRDHINKLQALQQKIQQARKLISSEDMAIVLLQQIWQLPSFSAFYSSLITSGRLTDITWEELVPMVLDQADQLSGPAFGTVQEALTGK